MAVADSILIFVLSLLVGTVAILAGVRLVVDRDAGFANAAVTALIGAIAWAITSFFVGWVPILGVVLMLVVWVGVINWRYPAAGVLPSRSASSPGSSRSRSSMRSR